MPKPMKYVGKEVDVIVSYRGDDKVSGMIVDEESSAIYLASNDESYSGCYDEKAEGTKYSYCYYLSKSQVTITLVDTNEMPELEAGMIVDYAGEYMLCLPMASNKAKIGFYTSTLYGAEQDTSKINAIYIAQSCIHYKAIFEDTNIKKHLELVWSKTIPKTDEEIKIEELEKTVESALAQIKDIKGE
jgi:hypothetical protein